MPKVTVMPQPNIPDTTQAEEWISPFVFLYKGDLWEVRAHGEVIPAEEHSPPKTSG